jgi:hypothetical protein
MLASSVIHRHPIVSSWIRYHFAKLASALHGHTQKIIRPTSAAAQRASQRCARLLKRRPVRRAAVTIPGKLAAMAATDPTALIIVDERPTLEVDATVLLAYGFGKRAETVLGHGLNHRHETLLSWGTVARAADRAAAGADVPD